MEREQDNAAAERKRPKRDRDHPPGEDKIGVVDLIGPAFLVRLCRFGGKALHTTAGGWPHFRKGGETMRFTFTFYIGRKTFTLSLVVKSNNRHPGR